MKWIAIAVALVPLLIATSAWWKVPLVAVETEIEIDGSAAEVWAVLIDFSHYAEWNPNLVEVRARAALGAPVEFRAVVDGSERALNAQIDVVTPERELVWTGPISRLERTLFWGEHHFTIEEPAPGRVRFRNHERFGGVLALPLAGYLRGKVAAAYHAANAGLKRRVEKRPR